MLSLTEECGLFGRDLAENKLTGMVTFANIADFFFWGGG